MSILPLPMLAILVSHLLCSVRRKFTQVINYSKECLQFPFCAWGISIGAFSFLDLTNDGTDEHLR